MNASYLPALAATTRATRHAASLAPLRIITSTTRMQTVFTLISPGAPPTIVAQARIDAANLELNRVASKVAAAILILTDNDMSSPLFKAYFGTHTTSEFKKPKGPAKAAAMAVWKESLERCPFPTLQALAPEVGAAVTEAQAAFKARDQAQSRMRMFRSVGERRQWVDRLNATRKETYGLLAKLPHEQLGLPSDFADQFFKTGPARAEEEEKEPAEAEEEAEEETVERLEARIVALRDELATVEAKLAAAAATAAAAKKAAEIRAAREAELAELRRVTQELARRQAALEALLEGEPA